VWSCKPWLIHVAYSSLPPASKRSDAAALISTRSDRCPRFSSLCVSKRPSLTCVNVSLPKCTRTSLFSSIPHRFMMWQSIAATMLIVAFSMEPVTASKAAPVLGKRDSNMLGMLVTDHHGRECRVIKWLGAGNYGLALLCASGAGTCARYGAVHTHT
jgi:hypothetical protein